MEVDLFSVIPNAPALLGCAVVRLGPYVYVTGGLEQFSSGYRAKAPLLSPTTRHNGSTKTKSPARTPTPATASHDNFDAFSVMTGNSSTVKKIALKSTSNAATQSAQCLSQQQSASYLQLRMLHVPSATWSGVAVVSNGLSNRAFHAAVSVREDVLLFGGVIRSSGKVSQFQAVETDQNVIRIVRNAFGYTAVPIQLTANSALAAPTVSLDVLRRSGQSATACGQLGDCVVLFGGYEVETDKASQAVHLFRSKIELSSTITAATAEGSANPPTSTAAKVDAKANAKAATKAPAASATPAPEVSNPEPDNTPLTASALRRQRRQSAQQQRLCNNNAIYSLRSVEIDVAGSVHGLPCPRSHHSACLFTPDPTQPNRCFLLIHGGEDASTKRSLNDLWALDLTDVLTAEYAADAAAAAGATANAEAAAANAKKKDAKGGKDKDAKDASKPSARWIRLFEGPSSTTPVDATPPLLARSRHCMQLVQLGAHNSSQWPHNTSANAVDDWRIVLCGGMNHSEGPLPLTAFDAFQLTAAAATDLATPPLTVTVSNISSKANSSTYSSAWTAPAITSLLSEAQQETCLGASSCEIFAEDFEGCASCIPSSAHQTTASSSTARSIGFLVIGGSKSLANTTVTRVNETGRSLAVDTLSYAPHTYQHADKILFLSTHGLPAIGKRIRQLVMQAHAHLPGFLAVEDNQSMDPNQLLTKIVRFDNGDVYEGQVIRFKPLPATAILDDPATQETEEPIARDTEVVVHDSTRETISSLSAGDPVDRRSTVSMSGKVKSSDQTWHNSSHRSPYADRERELRPETIEEEENPEGIPHVHVPHGRGIMRFANGDVYEGEWAEGEKHGHGKHIIVHQDSLEHVYIGDFVYDQKTGSGTLTYPTPFIIFPSQSSSCHANNTQSTPQRMMNMTYTGEFLNGLFHGEGSLLMEDALHQLHFSRKFSGHFLHHRKHGQGKILTMYHDVSPTADPTVVIHESEVVGEWKDDRLTGFADATGLVIYSINTSLGYLFSPPPVNSFQSLALHEHVLSEEDDGDVHSLQNPPATVAELKSLAHKIDAARQQQLWLQGKYSGPVVGALDTHLSLLSPAALLPYAEYGVCRYVDGSEYRGQWRTGRRNGNGTFSFRNGDRYEGKWLNDLRVGFGKFLARFDGIVASSSVLHIRDHRSLTDLVAPLEDVEAMDSDNLQEFFDKHTISTDVDGNKFMSIYEGQWNRNGPDGEGLCFDRDRGEYYIGQFALGVKDGTGRVHDIATDEIKEQTIFVRNHAAMTNKSALGTTTSLLR